MKKILVISLVSIVSIYFLLYISPYFIRNHFNKNAEEYIGRKAFMKDLSFNPFTGGITSTQMTVFEKEDSSAFVGYGNLYANIHFLKLVTGKIQFEEVRLDSPFVHMIYDSGVFNFDDLIPSEDSVQSSEEESDIQFEILNFQMTKGLATYFDKGLDHEVDMKDLSLTLPRFAYDSEQANMDIKLIVNETGQLAIKNDYYPNEDRFESLISVRGLNLDIIEPYLGDYVVAEDFEGHSGGYVKISGTFGEVTQLNVSGNAWATQLILKDTAAMPVFQADSVLVSLNDINVFEEKYELGRVFADGLKMRFDMFDSTNNMMVLFDPLLESEDGSSNDVSTDTVPTEVSYFYSIDTFLIVNSEIKYRDYALDEYFEYNISSITALADNIRSDSSQAKMSSSGVLNVKGNYNANLLFNPQVPLDFSLDFEVKGFQMEDLSPFSLTYAGHPIFEGNLVYSGKTTVKDGIMDSNNKITVYELEVGDRVSKNVLYVLPLKFGVFLLKDKDGVVNLDLAMGGNLYDPEFEVWPLVWQIIKQNLDKVVAAPGKLLANMFGMKEEEIQYIAFEPLDSLAGEEQTHSLDVLLELMNKKPGLSVELAYFEPDQIESSHFAVKEAKTKYIHDKLKLENGDDDMDIVDDDDIHFANFIKEQLLLLNPEMDSTALNMPTDSLAIKLIGMENVLPMAMQLEDIRKNQIEEYLNSIDSTMVHNFSFVELEDLPDFPVEKSGFVIGFGVE